MATGTVATAAGAALILYFLLSRRLSAKEEENVIDPGSDDDTKSSRSVRRKIARRPVQAPGTWLETMSTLSETLRFTYSETLGKWPIGDLAFGINYLMRRQENLQAASVYAGSDCIRLNGSEVVVKLKYFLRLLTCCMLFSKKPFPVFLDSAGYTDADVLLQKPKAGLLKPAFTILCDHSSKCFLLLIRGTHSIKDTLTAATGAVVPFHHSVLHDGGISNLILGYAHCGMVAAACWIAKLSTPCLIKALDEHPDYNMKVVGHSLGGGTAALLTYILREQKEFYSSTCVTFAPPACMTWELAESGKHFITTIINGSDLVPTFSAGSVDDLRSEVTTSSWLNDLHNQVQQTRVLNVVYRSATAISSCLPSIASAKARIAGAGVLLQPVSRGTEVVMKRAQHVAVAVARRRPALSSWSCMGARRRNVGQSLSLKEEDIAEVALISTTTDALVTENVAGDSEMYDSSSGNSGHDDTEDEEQLMVEGKDINTSAMEAINEGELWFQLEKELKKREEEAEVQAREEAADAGNEITEANVLAQAMEEKKQSSSSDVSENYRFYPPGRTMHMLDVPGDGDKNIEEHAGIYETPRNLYCKIRLTKTMINDHYMPMYKKMMEKLIEKKNGLGPLDQRPKGGAKRCTETEKRKRRTGGGTKK